MCSYKTHIPTFTPAFDVQEFSDRYRLDGELPGVDQKNIDIEFLNPQTLVVKGRIQRPTSPISTTSRYQPTVEDDDDTVSNPETGAKKPICKPTKPTATSQSSFHYWAAERPMGEFQRTFNFSTRVDQNEVRATLKHGILSVIVPKEVVKTKKIRIE